MAGRLRAWVRLVLIAVCTLVFLIIWGIGRILCLNMQRCAIRLRGFIVQSWARTIMRILGIRISVKGAPPEPPFCLVANHLSYIDILLFHTQVKGVLISRADVADWPIIGWLAKFSGTLFINRENIRDIVRVNRQIQGVLSRDDGVIFFPEGTSTSGESVTRFRSPLLNYPATFSYPVHYAAIGYSSDSVDVRKRVCWWEDIPFAHHMYALLTLPGFDARIKFGNDPVVESDRKRLAAELEQRVRDLFIPVRKIAES